MAFKKAEKQKLLVEIEAIEKEVGCYTMCVDVAKSVPRISTGIPQLDAHIGGGLPRGRIVELFAQEDVGKTSAALQICATVQKAFLKVREKKGQNKDLENLDCPGKAAFVDIEHKLDLFYAFNTYGIVLPRKAKFKLSGTKVVDAGFRPYQPESAEQAGNLIQHLVMCGKYDLVVADSAAAMCPQREIDAPIGKAQRQVQAQIMSQHMRKVSGPVAQNNVTLLYLNQARVEETLPTGQELWESPGARAFKHFAAMRLQCWKGRGIKDGDKRIGHIIKVLIKKNQVGPESGIAELYFYYGLGFCPYTWTLENAIALGIITAKGSNYSYKSNKIANGFQALRTWAAKYETTFKDIDAKVKEANAAEGQKADEDSSGELSESSDDDADLSF
jgi:recombination protein RecA